MNLSIELVPRTCWFSNLRSELPAHSWRALSSLVIKRVGRGCQTPGCTNTPGMLRGYGTAHCHERWRYDDGEWEQVLEGLVVLCWRCHEVKHFGYAVATGNGDRAFRWFCRRNHLSPEEASEILQREFAVWAIRSRHAWTLDISWLERQGLRYRTPKKGKRRAFDPVMFHGAADAPRRVPRRSKGT